MINYGGIPALPLFDVRKCHRVFKDFRPEVEEWAGERCVTCQSVHLYARQWSDKLLDIHHKVVVPEKLCVAILRVRSNWQATGERTCSEAQHHRGGILVVRAELVSGAGRATERKSGQRTCSQSR